MTAPFAAGQVWLYRTRPADVGSRLVIGLVECDQRLGSIVHVKLTGLWFDPGPGFPATEARTISHLPISAEALARSVTELTDEPADLSGLQHGYDLWKAEFEDGKAGIFTIEVAKIVEAMAAALRTT